MTVDCDTGYVNAVRLTIMKTDTFRPRIQHFLEFHADVKNKHTVIVIGTTQPFACIEIKRYRDGFS